MTIEREGRYKYHHRKADQAWEMAGLARQDGDFRDAERWTNEARKHDRRAKEAQNPGPRELDQSVFDGQPDEVAIACVDYDGRLKFGAEVTTPRYTWASERWRGAKWVNEVPDSGYKPLTMIRRKHDV